MSDPVKYFESKLKNMCLAELQDYRKRLDESIKQKIEQTAPNEKIAPLILYRGIVEHEMTSRINKMKNQ